MAGDTLDRPLPEWEVHAEHLAALDATLFAATERPVVLELSDGELRAPRPRR